MPLLDDAWDSQLWHWVAQGSGTDAALHGVSMADANNGVAVGEFYGVARRTTVSDTHGVCDPWCAKTAECEPADVAGCDLECNPTAPVT